MLFTLSSTLVLTALLLIGLFFFIKASVKERPQTLQLVSTQSPEATLLELQTYLGQRAYRAIAAPLEQTDLIFMEGIVRPSWFLAIFLSILAAIGMLCFSLILSFLYPDIGSFAILPVLLAPLVGSFYWKKAKRTEQISLSVSPQGSVSIITVNGHRDELQTLRQNLSLQIFDQK